MYIWCADIYDIFWHYVLSAVGLHQHIIGFWSSFLTLLPGYRWCCVHHVDFTSLSFSLFELRNSGVYVPARGASNVTGVTWPSTCSPLVALKNLQMLKEVELSCSMCSHTVYECVNVRLWTQACRLQHSTLQSLLCAQANKFRFLPPGPPPSICQHALLPAELGMCECHTPSSLSACKLHSRQLHKTFPLPPHQTRN